MYLRYKYETSINSEALTLIFCKVIHIVLKLLKGNILSLKLDKVVARLKSGEICNTKRGYRAFEKE